MDLSSLSSQRRLRTGRAKPTTRRTFWFTTRPRVGRECRGSRKILAEPRGHIHPIAPPSSTDLTKGRTALAQFAEIVSDLKREMKMGSVLTFDTKIHTAGNTRPATSPKPS